MIDDSIHYAKQLAEKIKFFNISRYQSLGDPNFKDYESLKNDARQIVSYLENIIVGRI